MGTGSTQFLVQLSAPFSDGSADPSQFQAQDGDLENLVEGPPKSEAARGYGTELGALFGQI